MRKRRRPSGAIVARYDYRDETGKLLYQVRRHDPKGFTVVTASGKPLTQDQRYRRLPYRLPELLAADPKQTIFVVEGEKDADRLMANNLLTTCNAFGGGAGKWTRGHSQYLRGRPVVVLPDNDHTGEEHGHAVANALLGVAASVKLIELPGLPRKGDVSDWLDAGHDLKDLLDLVAVTPQWKPRHARLPELWWPETWQVELDQLKTARHLRRQILSLAMPPAMKLLLILISDYHAPSQKEIAKYLGVTDRHIRQMLTSLVKDRFVTETKSGRRKHYRIADEWSFRQRSSRTF
jgi:hypothetical protein